MTWRQAYVFGELRWFWDEGQRRRRYYRERPQSSRVIVDWPSTRGAELARFDVTEPAQPAIAAALGVFGLSHGYRPSELSTAYRRLALEHHPDHGGDLRTMQAINDAYDWLRAQLGAKGV